MQGREHMQRPWMAATVKRGNERTAVENIKAQGHEPYYPRIEQGVKLVPLFPGFMFVRMPVGGNWSWLTGTRGIKHVLMAGGQPALAPHKAIKALKQLEKKDGLVKLPPRFKHGDEVEVTRGHLAGWFHGLYDGLDGDGRARILYKMLGLDQSVSVELWKLRPYAGSVS